MKRALHLLLFMVFCSGTVLSQDKHLYLARDSAQGFGSNLIEIDQNQNSTIVLADSVVNEVWMVNNLKFLNANSMVGYSQDNYYATTHLIRVDRNSGNAEIALKLSKGIYLDGLFVRDSQTVYGIASSLNGSPMGGVIKYDLTHKTQTLVQSFDTFNCTIDQNALYDRIGHKLYAMTYKNKLTQYAYLISYDLDKGVLSKLDSFSDQAYYNLQLGMGLVDTSGLLLVRRNSLNIKRPAFFYHDFSTSITNKIYEYKDSVNYVFNKDLAVEGKKLYSFVRNPSASGQLFYLDLTDTTQSDTFGFQAYQISVDDNLSRPILNSDGTVLFIGRSEVTKLYELDLPTKQLNIKHQRQPEEGFILSNLDRDAQNGDLLFLASGSGATAFGRTALVMDSTGNTIESYVFHESRYGLLETTKIYQFKSDKLLLTGTFGGKFRHGAFYELDRQNYTPTELYSFTGDTYDQPISRSLLQINDTCAFVAFKNNRLGVFSWKQNEMLYGLYRKGKLAARPYLYENLVYVWLEDSTNFTRSILYEYNTADNTLRELSDMTKLQQSTGCFTPGKSMVRIGDYLYIGQFCSAAWGGAESTGLAKLNVNSLAVSHSGTSIQKAGIETSEGVVKTLDNRIALMSKYDPDEGWGKLILYTPADSSFEIFKMPGRSLGYGLDGPINYSGIDNSLYFFCSEAALPNGADSGIILKFDLNKKAFYRVGDYNPSLYEGSELLTISSFPTYTRNINELTCTVYPNPSSHDWNIQWNSNTAPTWELYNLQGKKLGAGEGFAVSSDGLSKGIYFLKLSDGVSVRSIRVEKIR